MVSLLVATLTAERTGSSEFCRQDVRIITSDDPRPSSGLGALDPRGPVVAPRVQQEGLDHDGLALGVDAAHVRADLAPGDLLDRLADLARARVLEEQTGVA